MKNKYDKNHKIDVRHEIYCPIKSKLPFKQRWYWI